MRISRGVAIEVANKMTEKKEEEITKIREEVCKRVTEYVESKVPDEVMKLFKKHRSFFSSSDNVQFGGNGFNYEYLQMQREVPMASSHFVPDTVAVKEIKPLLDSINKKNKEVRTLRNEIETALVNLRTYANVKEQFKEAYKFLPTEKSQALVVNIDKIREKL